MSEFWRRQLGLPCVRVSRPISRDRDYGYHGLSGELVLYLDCRQEGRSFYWRIFNLDSRVESEANCCGWDPAVYLMTCSDPLEQA